MEQLPQDNHEPSLGETAHMHLLEHAEAEVEAGVMSEKEIAELLQKIESNQVMAEVFDMRDLFEMMVGQTFDAIYGNLLGMLYEEGVKDPEALLAQAGILE